MLLYAAYETHTALAQPLRSASGLTASLLGSTPRSLTPRPLRMLGSLGEVVAGARLTHRRPDFGIVEAEVDGRPVAVQETKVLETPFVDLLHFAKEGGPDQPKVLLVAALSGHFATMLRPTVQALLSDHDVYVTDWHNMRDVPLAAGPFGLDDYIEAVIRFVRFIGPGSHLMAVCQPCNAALAATAILAEAQDDATPSSLTLMSGPIDARVNPSPMNAMAEGRSVEWLAKNVITTVPHRYPGGGRRVYPGFLQVSAFMSLNMKRHLGAHRDIYRALVAGDVETASTTQAFYDEYFAVLDLAEEFYLDTVRAVFKDHDLARGVMHYRGDLVRPELIDSTALMTVEAELDDMCGAGQTAAAHALTPRLGEAQRRRHVQAGVGHYGIFAGHRWQHEVYPAVRDFIAANAST